MRSFVVVVCLNAVAAHFFPSPEKFKSLVAACENMDLLTNCSSTLHGVCKTGKDGSRWCNTYDHHDHDHHHHHHEHHGFHYMMHEMKEMMGPHHKHHGEWKHVGDCDANKQDGAACKVDQPGQCIPSGKCPMFHGEMVCRPNNAHPPKFVTEPCEGKNEGDQCSHLLMPGKCKKPKYMVDMYCKVDWPTTQEIGSVITDLSKMLTDSSSENSENSKLQSIIV